MSARRVVVLLVAQQRMTQVPLSKNDDMVKALPSDRADQTLRISRSARVIVGMSGDRECREIEGGG